MMDARGVAILKWVREQGWNPRELDGDQVDSAVKAFSGDGISSPSQLCALLLQAQLREAVVETQAPRLEQAEQGFRPHAAAALERRPDDTRTPLLHSSTPTGLMMTRQQPLTERTLLADPEVRRWVDSKDGDRERYALSFADGALTVSRPGKGRIYEEQVRLPKGIEAFVLKDRYLVLRDTFGGGFTMGGGFGASLMGDMRSNYVLVSLNPFGLKRDDAVFTYDLVSEGKVAGGGFATLQEFIDGKMMDSIYPQEFEAQSTMLTIGGRRILARGPNRNGDYELTSGRSSILYHPRNGTLTLTPEWSNGGAVSSIIDADLTKGSIRVREDRGEHGQVIWQIDLQFGNIDPKKSYIATKVE